MNLSDFLDQFDQVLDAGDGNFLVRCPSHDDGAPSLLCAQSATDGRLLLYCRAGCTTDSVLGKLGLERRDMFSANKRPDTRRPVTAITPDPDGPTIEDTARLAMYSQRCREHLLDDTEIAEQARAYIHDRWGLTPDTAVRLGVGLDPGGMWFDNDDLRFSPTYWNVPRITIAFRSNDGMIVGSQGRALGESKARWAGPMNPEGRAWSRYAFMTLDTQLETIVICEGPGDGVCVTANTGLDCLAIRGAAIARSERLTTEIATAIAGRRVVIAGDNDDAGQRFTQILADALSGHGVDVYVLEFPDDVNDVSDWRALDPDGFGSAFADAVDQAIAWESVGITSPGEPPMKSTEVAMAQHLREILRLPSGHDGVIHCGGQGWFVWSGRGWKRDSTASYVRRAAQEESLRLEAEGIDLFEEALGDPDLEALANAKRIAGQRMQRSHFLNGVISELRVMVMVDPDELDRHGHLLNVENGVVDLRDGSLMDHDPALYLTKIIETPYIRDAECPRWEQFVLECHPSDGMSTYIQDLAGYSICGNPLQLLFIHHGQGANGKSTWVEALTHVLGGVSVHAPFSTFEMKSGGGVPNDLAMLAGSRLVVANEGEAGKGLSESVIKKISGGDTLTARWMRGEFFSFEARFTTHLLTNHAPTFGLGGQTSQSQGLWRRLRMVRWEQTWSAEERDPYLLDRLKQEEQGILRWVVEGAVRFHQEGLNEPSSVLTATRDYRDSSDLLGSFIDTHLVPERGARTAAPALYQVYVNHMLDVEGVKESEVLSARRFYADIRDRGFNTSRGRVNGSITMMFAGLRLRTADEVASLLEDPDVTVEGKSEIGVPKLTS